MNWVQIKINNLCKKNSLGSYLSGSLLERAFASVKYWQSAASFININNTHKVKLSFTQFSTRIY